MGFVFCASPSVTLTLCFSSFLIGFGGAYSSVNRGGLVSLISGTVPAIELSGIPEFRGGAGTGSRECGQ